MKSMQSRFHLATAISFGRARTEDEETEELQIPKVLRLTESTCTSPSLWRRDLSTLASFVSQPTPSDDDLTARPYKPPPPEHEIQRIKKESEEAKDYLREFARSLHARAEEVRSHSVLSYSETRAMRAYLGKLSKRLDELLEEAEETDKKLSEWMKASVLPRQCSSSFMRSSTELPLSCESGQSFERRLQQLEVATASLVRSPTCALEGAEASKPACCAFFRF